jgi:predicted DNA-binding transcriptional regulator AlpA
VSNFTELPPELAGKRVLGTRKAAEFVGLSDREWDRRRAAGETPTPVELGTRKLGYTVESLVAWIEARKKNAAA